ncbi:acyl-CoA dehydrogenase family protein [Saccharopolyspora cebuensis]|uniref:Acyl-CoA dehydrogenase family protein n=1 Tax=Saccharopolyspora cebuensis TaxID=418759 RepID=A0ABV4CFP6_9PSEU
MRFAPSNEHTAFAASLGELLRGSDVPGIARAWAEGDHGPGLALWHRLAELGVTALLVPEDAGGLGADAVDLAIAFEVLGYHAVPGPLVESAAVVPVLLAGSAAGQGWLPRLAAGESLATVAVHPHVPHALDADVAALRLSVTGDEVRVCTGTGTGPLRSVDPARRLFALPPGELLPIGCGAAFDHGVLAVSSQLIGAAQRVLDDSVAHAARRTQYGREIGRFQAVKHLLADVAVAVELARPLVRGAAVALAGAAPEAARDVSAARVAAADAAHLAVRTGLQVHGAVGYTREHDLGLWLTKVRALIGGWGTGSFHRRRVREALTGAADGSGGGRT